MTMSPESKRKLQEQIRAYGALGLPVLFFPVEHFDDPVDRETFARTGSVVLTDVHTEEGNFPVRLLAVELVPGAVPMRGPLTTVAALDVPGSFASKYPEHALHLARREPTTDLRVRVRCLCGEELHLDHREMLAGSSWVHGSKP